MEAYGAAKFSSRRLVCFREDDDENFAQVGVGFFFFFYYYAFVQFDFNSPSEWCLKRALTPLGYLPD